MNEIEIECLATQLPEHITVDLSNATTGTAIHTGDIQLPKGVKLVLHGRSNLTVATMVAPVAEVVAAPVAAAVDPKAKGKGKK
jgi:large subunit ribosomal protein L25